MAINSAFIKTCSPQTKKSGNHFPLRSARGLDKQVTFPKSSRQAVVRFDLTLIGQSPTSQHSMISRSQAFLIVLLVWTAIYLPALGSLEIKGEEGRRILPAVRMIETGDYVVPRVGSEPYLRKPPLINWLVAASFKTFGQRNEWTARLPSALWVLAVAAGVVTVWGTRLCLSRLRVGAAARPHRPSPR